MKQARIYFPPSFAKRSSIISPAIAVILIIASITLISIAKISSFWPMYLMAFVINAGIQHHQLILLHDISHGSFLPNKKANDFFGNLLAGAPVLTLAKFYRLLHLPHHRFNGIVGKDPELDLYRGQNYTFQKRDSIELIQETLKDFIGINAFKFARDFNSIIQKGILKKQASPFNLVDVLIFAIFWIPALIAINHFQLWKEFLLLWILPMPTLLFFFLKWHGYGEHIKTSSTDELDKSFHHHLPFLTNFFFYPLNSGYHQEHHLFAHVPWYGLPQTRQYLIENYPDYKAKCQINVYDSIFIGPQSILSAIKLGLQPSLTMPLV